MVGKRVHLTGWARGTNGAHVLVGVGGPPHLGLSDQSLTTEWRRFDLELDVPSGAADVTFGLFVDGEEKEEGMLGPVEFEVLPGSAPRPEPETVR